MAVAVPLVPSTEAGGDWLAELQQTTLPVPAWIAQLCEPPAAIAVAVPLAPLTEVGVDIWPPVLSPQQTTFPVPAWIAQLW